MLKYFRIWNVHFFLGWLENPQRESFWSSLRARVSKFTSRFHISTFGTGVEIAVGYPKSRYSS